MSTNPGQYFKAFLNCNRRTAIGESVRSLPAVIVHQIATNIFLASGRFRYLRAGTHWKRASLLVARQCSLLFKSSLSHFASITSYLGYTRPVYGYKARPNFGCTTTLLVRHRLLQFFRPHPLSQASPETLSAPRREAHLSSSLVDAATDRYSSAEDLATVQNPQVSTSTECFSDECA